MARAKLATTEQPKRVLTGLAMQYKGLEFEPLMLQAALLLQKRDVSLAVLSNRCGVTQTTMRNWMKRKTRRPNASTLRFVLRSLGYNLKITKD
jgi:hypothetical protein